MSLTGKMKYFESAPSISLLKETVVFVAFTPMYRDYFFHDA